MNGSQAVKLPYKHGKEFILMKIWKCISRLFSFLAEKKHSLSIFLESSYFIIKSLIWIYLGIASAIKLLNGHYSETQDEPQQDHKREG